MATTDVGFIGLGRMGFPMARNLGAKGYRVRVFDVDTAVAARAAGQPGVTATGSPKEVAAAVDAVFTALPDDDVVTETYLGRQGVLAGGRAGLVTCDCSTVSPEVSQRISAAAAHKGVIHLDTPMLGSSPQAESGEVFFMVGGDREALARVEPLLSAMGRLTMYVGPSGMGNRIKLLHNALGAVNAVAVAESLALCATLGVNPGTYIDVVRNGGGMAFSTYFDRRAERVVEGNYAPTFTLDLMHKDVTLASRMAAGVLDRLPILRETLAAYTDGRAAGFGALDFSAVSRVVAQRLDTRVGPAGS
jgi:3-hydroxyisobutyrate dehydrogenase-like beta-hydroxyacid dehydrogenase